MGQLKCSRGQPVSNSGSGMYPREPLGAIKVDSGELLATGISVWQLQVMAKWQVLTL